MDPFITATLAFTRPEDVTIDDPIHGLRRARSLDPAAMSVPGALDLRACRLHDLARSRDFLPDLRIHGFDRLDLRGHARLQAALERVRVAGRVDPSDAAEIRRRLIGRKLPLASGGHLRLLFIAREGFLMRKAGPGWRRHGGGDTHGINGHDAATAVHADQDIDGTPLRQLLFGLAPRIFRHDSPAHDNPRSRIFLVNLWIGLDQVTRPLALMDPRTLDRRRHQLRFGLPTDAFLRRRPDMRVNDIWSFLHDDAQRWYFTSELDAGTAYVFATLSAPHGSFVVPGEARAGAVYDRITGALLALGRGDRPAALAALDAIVGDDGQTPATAALARRIAELDALVVDGQRRLRDRATDDTLAAWATAASAAASRLVRKSIEMRCVAYVSRE